VRSFQPSNPSPDPPYTWHKKAPASSRLGAPRNPPNRYPPERYPPERMPPRAEPPRPPKPAYWGREGPTAPAGVATEQEDLPAERGGGMGAAWEGALRDESAAPRRRGRGEFRSDREDEALGSSDREDYRARWSEPGERSRLGRKPVEEAGGGGGGEGRGPESGGGGTETWEEVLARR